jgi:hypothetical protein
MTPIFLMKLACLYPKRSGQVNSITLHRNARDEADIIFVPKTKTTEESTVQAGWKKSVWI